MTSEIAQIRDEVSELSATQLDIPMLEALANNALYCLNNFQKENRPDSYNKRLTDTVITDVLATLTKELVWAQEELDNQNEEEAVKYFQKAQSQILADINQLFKD